MGCLFFLLAYVISVNKLANLRKNSALVTLVHFVKGVRSFSWKVTFFLFTTLHQTYPTFSRSDCRTFLRKCSSLSWTIIHWFWWRNERVVSVFLKVRFPIFWTMERIQLFYGNCNIKHWFMYPMHIIIYILSFIHWFYKFQMLYYDFVCDWMVFIHTLHIHQCNTTQYVIAHLLCI